jgi:hypothetical protein
MIEVADVFCRFAADYLSAHGASMLPSHRRAIDDILACRTAALGGQVWHCQQCGAEVFSYHSCGNRSYPKAGPRRTWPPRDPACHEGVDEPNWVVCTDIVVDRLRQQQRLGAVMTRDMCHAEILPEQAPRQNPLGPVFKRSI